ncbi:hypothetical protein D9M68_385530 [compost metagenome]
MAKRSIMPSLTISLPPPPPSSAGWKMTATLPAKLRVSARYLAAPRSIAVWPSWPQACILPDVSEAQGLPLVSVIGSASMSARRPIVRPEPRLPRIRPTTPVRPRPVTTSSTPNSLSFFSTKDAVFSTANRSSGFLCRWRRHSATSFWSSAARLSIGIGSSCRSVRSLCICGGLAGVPVNGLCHLLAI